MLFISLSISHILVYKVLILSNGGYSAIILINIGSLYFDWKIIYQMKNIYNILKFVIMISVTGLWVVYIVVIIMSFITFWLILDSVRKCYCSLGYGSVFFGATVIGAIFVLIGFLKLETSQLTPTANTWLNVLYAIAFSLPIFAIIYIVWSGEYSAFTGEPDYFPPSCTNPCPKPYVPQERDLSFTVHSCCTREIHVKVSY